MVEWLANYSEKDEVAFRIGREGDRVVAEWPAIVRVTARRDGSDVVWTEAPSANPLDLRKIRRGSARLLLRDLENKLAMHGAAIAASDSAVVLLGRSGQGKSTLAAAACAKRDCVLHSDDAIGLDAPSASGTTWMVEPFESDHWLDADASRALDVEPPTEGKRPHPATRRADRATPLVALIDLRWVDDLVQPRLRPLQGMDVLAALVPQVVRFILDEDARQRRELETLVALTSRVPMYTLERPRGFDQLMAAADLVRSLLSRIERDSRLGFEAP